MITPFDDAGRVDEEALERHAEEVIASGAAGIVAVATTGEATSLDENERADFKAVTVSHAYGKIATPHVHMLLADASPTAAEQALALLDSLVAEPHPLAF